MDFGAQKLIDLNYQGNDINEINGIINDNIEEFYSRRNEDPLNFTSFEETYHDAWFAQRLSSAGELAEDFDEFRQNIQILIDDIKENSEGLSLDEQRIYVAVAISQFETMEYFGGRVPDFIPNPNTQEKPCSKGWWKCWGKCVFAGAASTFIGGMTGCGAVGMVGGAVGTVVAGPVGGAIGVIGGCVVGGISGAVAGGILGYASFCD